MLAPEKAPGFPFHQQISVGKVQKTFNNSKARDVLGFDTGIDLDQVTHEFAKKFKTKNREHKLQNILNNRERL
jgi:nucleoside-diphosphate-sugar epimerase